MNKKGQALAVAYTVIAALLVVASGLLYKAVSDRTQVLVERQRREAFYLAEGAVEYAICRFSQGIGDYQIDPAILLYTVNSPFASQGGMTVPVTISRLDNSDRVLVENQTNVLARNFEVEAAVTHPANSAVKVTVHHIITRRLIPTFQHAVFYNDDLEMLPGPAMSLTGRIHSNRDIYMDSHATLTLDSAYVHSAGDIFNNRKDEAEMDLEGDVLIRVNKGASPLFAGMSGLDSTSPGWTQGAIDRWGGTVQSAVHGVTKLTAPSVASIQPDGYYASRADVVITNGTIVKGGVTLVQGRNCPSGTVTTTTSLYNIREGKYVKATEVDLRKLAGYAPGDAEGKPSFPNNLPANGLVYATRNGTVSTQEPGIRLKNGSQVYRSGGLTVVSNNPVYVQGNYNTLNEKPTAIICDALTLLSNSWNDANSASSNLNNRMASVTTVNSAFISGIDNSSIGHYNGGLENYPRLLENWTDVTLNIKGSFVELWNSQFAKGGWIYGSPQYTAPDRNWQYNTAFNDASKLPPFTPWAVEIRRVIWWQS